MLLPIRHCAVAVIILALPLCGLADTDVLARARQLLASGDSSQAYGLLAKQAGQRAGEPEFDFLLGKAALAAGRRTEAIFALERVLAVQPGNAEARMEIAKVHFEIKEWESAKQQFEGAQRQNTDPELTPILDRYLEGLAWLSSDAHTPVWQKAMAQYVDEEARSRALSPRQGRLWGFAETFAGYNSNINGGTSQGRSAIPAYGGTVVPLAPDAKRTGSGQGGFSAGIAFEQPLTVNWSLIGGATGRDKETGNRFNTTSLDGYGGLQLLQGRHTFTVLGEAEHFMLDKEAYRNVFGGMAQWSYLIDGSSRIAAYFRGSKLEYPGQSIQDGDRYIGGVNYTKSFGGPRAPLLYTEIFGGTQRENAERAPHLGYDLQGIRLGGSVALTQNISLFASGNAEFRRYHGAEPLFLRTRADNQGDVSLGVEYRPASLWRIVPRVMYINNSSNIKLFDYNGIQYTVNLRRDF